MDNNAVDTLIIIRKIYTREELNLIRNSELSNLWPKTLDKTCTNSNGQWDPVKSFDNAKPNDSKRNILYETKGYRSNEKNTDDISLRPERRKWNDGCQVSSNKRNNEEIHTNSYRKAYQGITPSNGGGDYDKRNFNRTNNRNVKLRDGERDIKFNNLKPEKYSKNISYDEERRENGKEEHKYHLRNGNNNNSNTKNNEPEWFSNGPDNCEETIELRGITEVDSAIVDFKKNCFPKMEIKDGPDNGAEKNIDDRIVLNLPNDKPLFIDTCVTSPKREGSRFQEIFQKETENNYLKESKDVENILKAVLSENVSQFDAERLHNASKPLPNGVLTLEEIEKGLISSQTEMNQMASKSTTIDTLTSFEPSQNSFISSGVTSPSVDNSKVVNWLSNLNVTVKDIEDHEQSPFCYPDSSIFAPVNQMINPQQRYMPANYPITLTHPPGLPLMLNPGSMLPQQAHNHQLRTHPMIQQHGNFPVNQTMQQSLSNQNNAALFSQLTMNLAGNANTSPRTSVPNINQQEVYKIMNHPASGHTNSVHPDGHAVPNLLSAMFQHTPHMSQTNHITDHVTYHNDNGNHHTGLINGPPGLVGMSRAIVKTHRPSDASAANIAQFYQSGFQFYGPSHPDVAMPPRMGDHWQRQAQGGHHGPQMLANLFSVNCPAQLPPLPQQAVYADQIETENV